MSIDLDNPTPETAQHVRMIESLCKERDQLRKERDHWISRADEHRVALHSLEDAVRKDAAVGIEVEARLRTEVDLLTANVAALTADLKKAEARIAEAYENGRRIGEAVGRQCAESIAIKERDEARAACRETHDNLEAAVRQYDEAKAEIERLTRNGPLWLQHAIAKMHCMVDQTDPKDIIGSALTHAGLERWSCSPEDAFTKPAAQEVVELRAEVERMRAVYEAATRWESITADLKSSANDIGEACHQLRKALRAATTKPEAGE